MAKNKKTSEFVEAEKVEEELEELEDDEELEEDEDEVEEDEEESEEFEEEEETPRKGSFVNWIKTNSLAIICGIVGLLIGVVIMALMWPERLAQLSNGEEVAATYKDKSITADDIYKKLKEKTGLSAVLEQVDVEYLTEKYKDRLDTIKESTNAGLEQYISYYTSMAGYSEEEFYDQMGFKGHDDMFEYMFNNSLREEYIKEYASQNITDVDIQSFYSGDKHSVYIFMGENKDDLESVRGMLKAKKKFSDIDGKYESVTAMEYTDVSFLDVYKDYSGEITQAIRDLKDGAYSKVLNSKTYKYFVVYASGTAEKATLNEDLAEEIKALLIEDARAIDPKISEKALIKMRDEMGLEFKDSELAKAYNTYRKQYE